MKKKHLKHAEKAFELVSKAVDHINELYDDCPYCDASPEEKNIVASLGSLRDNIIWDKRSLEGIVNCIREQV